MKKLLLIFAIISFKAQAGQTTLEQKKAWAKKTCESFKITGEDCVVEQIDFAPKWN
jgi:hypothetical protein